MCRFTSLPTLKLNKKKENSGQKIKNNGKPGQGRLGSVLPTLQKKNLHTVFGKNSRKKIDQKSRPGGGPKANVLLGLGNVTVQKSPVYYITDQSTNIDPISKRKMKARAAYNAMHRGTPEGGVKKSGNDTEEAGRAAQKQKHLKNTTSRRPKNFNPPTLMVQADK